MIDMRSPTVTVPLLLQRRTAQGAVTGRDRWLLSAFRTAALAVLAFALFRPVLLISTVVPRRNYVAVVLDDSRSMRVGDEDGSARGSRLLDLFGGGRDEPSSIVGDDGARVHPRGDSRALVCARTELAISTCTSTRCGSMASTHATHADRCASTP